jgi:hypothetical protein
METEKQTSVLFEKLVTLFAQFKEEHPKTTKVAHKKARALLSEVKKLISPYNNASVQEDKETKG